MSWGMVAVAGASVVGGAMASNSAKRAAKGQEEAAREANELQRYMYDRNVELSMPSITAGNLARDSLLYRLGLAQTPGAGSNGQKFYSEAELREQLTPQFTKYASATQSNGGSSPNGVALNMSETLLPYEAVEKYGPDGAAMYIQQKYGNDPGMLNSLNIITGRSSYEPYRGEGSVYTINGPNAIGANNPTGGSLDTAGLDAEVAKRLAAQEQAKKDYAAQIEGAGGSFGDLSKKFEFEKYTPGTFSYTGEDLYKDPSYQFRLEQGQKALDRAGAASGRFLSGKQLQASSDYNQGAASQEFQNAYTRALQTFGTNEGNRKNAFDTNEGNRFNAYQANFSNAINPLLALSGSGQVSAQFLGNAGSQSAAQQSNNLIGAANAAGAGQIASSNAISGGINSAAGMYNQNQLLNSLMKNNGGVNNNPGSANGSYWNSWANTGTGGD